MYTRSHPPTGIYTHTSTHPPAYTHNAQKHGVTGWNEHSPRREVFALTPLDTLILVSLSLSLSLPPPPLSLSSIP